MAIWCEGNSSKTIQFFSVQFYVILPWELFLKDGKQLFLTDGKLHNFKMKIFPSKVIKDIRQKYAAKLQ